MDRCDRCHWLFTADQWDDAEFDGRDCPIYLEPEPSTPRRHWSWLEARFAHAPIPAPALVAV